MSVAQKIPPEIIARQTEASDPETSAWVSANAGSGKTYVLAQRVIRLLLDGVDPARILCITFTKAAAANMANRVFSDLRAWTLLDDAALDAEMKKAGVKKIDARQRARARQLFALALETPGGLKVQTIHAFCTQLLHLFPFEANVAARFEVLDDIAETQMLAQMSLDVLLQAAQAPETPLGKALAQAILSSADVTFQEMVREAIRNRDALERWVAQAGGIDKAAAQLSRSLGVDAKDTLTQVDKAIFEQSLIAGSEWAAIGATMMGGSANDKKQGALFHKLAALAGTELIEAYLDIFCTKDRKKTKDSIATSAIEKSDPALCSKLNDERERVWALVQKKRAIEARDRSSALFTLAHAVLARFGAEKDRRGLLGYDDLIDKTLELLKDQRAAWVHYKLDRGIHHVLIDEAQDTSPKQWEIVKSLVAEFFAGSGAHVRPRTIFAVGDEKQSIFSFQGAAPHAFAEMLGHFRGAHQRANLGFVATEFKHSFRSGKNVLGAVDTVFKQSAAFAGLSVNAEPPLHEALPDKAPGLVEIWDLLKSDEREKKEGWKAPFDVQTLTSGTVKLARRIAKTVAAWQWQGRRPKDVLVLLRRRGALFEAIIRALKKENIAVAGADRMVMTDHIAVMDLMALADAVLLPEDDLALATVLKSPLFGLDDDALFALAWERTGSLHAALGERQPQLAARFDEMRKRARVLSPFAFYAWLLGAGEGRRQMLARLGHEAADALDEFLNLALDYERSETPSLQGFLAWLRAAEVNVKRDMEMDRDEVRVMTVHGAKGLEAPIVILADTVTPPHGWHPPKLLKLLPEKQLPDTASAMIWAGSKDFDVGPMAAARAAILGEAGDEYRRLLYVAMTRAIERLVVCGIDNGRKLPEGCWYTLVREALEAESKPEPADDGEGEVLRYRKVPEKKSAAETGSGKPTSDLPPPPWLRQPLGEAPSRVITISPSAAGADLKPVGRDVLRMARQRGIIVHRLLQALPDIPADRQAAAMSAFLDRYKTDLAADVRDAIAAQVRSILTNGQCSALFGPGSRAEVPIVGELALGGKTVRVSGQIDRLSVTETAVLIGDFKTGARPAQPPESYLRQLALYRAVLAVLYPKKQIRAALIWTEVPEFAEISSHDLDAALARVTSA